MGGGAGDDTDPADHKLTYNVTTPSNAGLYIVISRTEPADPVRNISLRLPNYADTTEAFESEFFLARLAPYDYLRFMNWGATNNSQLQHWSDRPRVGDMFYGGEKGVPYELMIELCNQTQKDMWICVPHLATDDYVKQLAKLIHDTLDDGLMVYVEYSNEVWNGIFAQSSHALTMGNNLGLSQPNDDDQRVRARYTAHRSMEIFDIFEARFGGIDRIIRVLPGQGENEWYAEALLTHDNAYQAADVYAITNYFNDGVIDEAVTNEWYKSSNYTAAFNYLDNQLRAKTTYADVALAQSLGMHVITYEGGPHIDPQWKYKNNTEYNSILAFCEGMNAHPRMYDTYNIMLDFWFNTSGAEAHTSFVHAGSPLWGHYFYYNQPISKTDTPKYQLMLDWSE